MLAKIKLAAVSHIHDPVPKDQSEVWGTRMWVTAVLDIIENMEIGIHFEKK